MIIRDIQRIVNEHEGRPQVKRPRIFRQGSPPEERFALIFGHINKIARIPGMSRCWETTFVSKNNQGYPMINLAGKTKTVVRHILCHQLSREPLIAAHICNNPSCTNPKHIEEISNWLNLLDSSLHRGEFGQFSSEVPGVYKMGVYWRVHFGGHTSKKYHHIAICHTEADAALVAIPLYLEEMEQEPKHIQQTCIYKRCRQRLRQLLRKYQAMNRQQKEQVA